VENQSEFHCRKGILSRNSWGIKDRFSFKVAVVSWGYITVEAHQIAPTRSDVPT
jgi:hypothetical protein